MDGECEKKKGIKKPTIWGLTIGKDGNISPVGFRGKIGVQFAHVRFDSRNIEKAIEYESMEFKNCKFVFSTSKMVSKVVKLNDGIWESLDLNGL